MKNKLRDLKLRFFLTNLFKYLGIILISIAMLGVPALYSVRHQVKAQIERATDALFGLSSNSVETLFATIGEIRTYCDTNPDFLIYLLTLSLTGNLFENEAFKNWQNYINNTLLTRPYIHSVCIVKDGSSFVIANDHLYSQRIFGNPDYYRYLTSYPHAIVSSHHLAGFDQMGQDVVTIITPLKYNFILSVNIPLGYFRTILNEATQYTGQLVWLEEPDGIIVAGNSSAEPYIGDSGIELRNKTMSSYYLQDHTLDLSLERLKLVSAMPLRIMMAPGNELERWLKITILFAFVAATLISFYLTIVSTRKINRILHLFEAYQPEDTLNLHSGAFDTYSYILEQVAETYVRESKLKEKIVQHDYELVSSELTALQYQINPHFIFNTLQSIDLEIKANLSQSASKMIGLFSELLRYSIQNPNTLVPVKTEIEMTKQYAELANSRTDGKVRILWDYDEEQYGDARLIRLLFQPMIENVYQHGLWNDGKTTTVRIRLFNKSGYLSISVVDNGPGMDKRSLDNLKSHIAQTGPIDHHIGLANINRRLILKYGQESSLTLHSAPGLGLGIFIRISQKMIPFDSR